MIDITTPLDPWALDEARRILADLKQNFTLGSGQSFKRIALHWNVEGWGCDDTAHYDGDVYLGDGKWRCDLDPNLRDNATEPVGPNYAPHTAGANGNCFGIAVSGMIDATPEDYGANPIEDHETDVMCAFAAAIALWAGIDTVGYDPILKIHNVTTHALYAIRDGYYPGDPVVAGMRWSGAPYRWDLAGPKPKADGSVPSKSEAAAYANLLRAQIHRFKTQLAKEMQP